MIRQLKSIEHRIASMWKDLGIDPSSRDARASRETIARLLTTIAPRAI
jgi:hypothetical protein